jgi:hypothetical protein
MERSRSKDREEGGGGTKRITKTLTISLPKKLDDKTSKGIIITEQTTR